MSTSHATAYSGFFQSPPTLHNTFTSDSLLHRILKRHLDSSVLNSVTPAFTALGEEAVSRQILTYSNDAHTNLPRVIEWDGWGKRKDQLYTTEGWRKLKEFWARSGLMHDFYSRPYGAQSRIVGWTKLVLT